MKTFFLIAALCAGALQAAPLELALKGTPLRPPPAALQQGAGDDAVAGAIVWALRDTLDLPFPDFTLEVHDNRGEFETALVRHLGMTPQVARVTAGFAKAGVGNGRILVNQPALRTLPWKDQVVTVAHEMVHASLLELVGPSGIHRYQWLTEGFAEWAGYRVAHALGVGDAARDGASIRQRVAAARRAPGLAPLADCDTLEQWVRMREQRGFDAAYPYAWVATDFLMERHGYQRVLEFFRAFRVSRDPAANFRAAFGEDLAEFQRALDARLDELR